MRKKLIIALVAAAGGVLVALVLLPWWLGAALSVVGKTAGFRFGTYERIGYTRFALTEVEVDAPPVVVKVSRVELRGPYAWLVGRPGEVDAGTWSVAVTPPPTAKKPKTAPRGWVPLRAVLGKVIDQLERRLPPTRLGAGAVTWPGGGLTLQSAEWREQHLRVAGLSLYGVEGDVVVHRTADELVVEARSENARWNAAAKSVGAAVTASGTWHGQAVSLDAGFAPSGWLPKTATAKAVNWSLPAAEARMAEYYGNITGGAEVTWTEGALALAVRAAAEPLKDSEAPPLSVELHGSGGIDRLQLDRVDLRLPGVEGRLSEPLVIGGRGRLLSGASRFDLTADLEKTPWFKGKGVVTGRIEVSPRGEGSPLVEARLATKDATIADWRIATLAVNADIEWPSVRVKAADIQLAGGDALQAEGVWAARTKTLTAGKVHGRVSGDTLGRWLPAKTEFKSFEINATAEGTWPAIRHAGQVKADAFQVAPFHPVALAGTWNGTGAAVEAFSLEAAAEASRLQLKGAVASETLRLDALVLSKGDTALFHLDAPTRVTWKPALAITGLALKGEQTDIAVDLTWADTGAFAVKAVNFQSVWLADFVDIAGPEWTISRLETDGRWTEKGPLEFKAVGNGMMDLRDGRRVDLALSTHGVPGLVTLDAVNVTLSGQPVVRLSGAVPATVFPRGRPWYELHDREPLSLQLATEPNAAFWDQLGALAGVVVIDPSVNVAVTGTLEKPVGEATLHVTKLASRDDQKSRVWPSIDNLDARMTGDRSGVTLETFTLKADGQTVRASGRLPVKDWAALITDPLGLAGAGGEARIEIPDADVAALARYAPAYLAPVGKLTVDVSLKKGGQLEGLITLKDAATRPLGPLGVLQSIGAEIALHGRTAELKQVTASTGGQPVVLSGSIALPKDDVPRLNLTLKGEKLPFVRQSGLLVRGDIDLKIATGADDITRITGATRLRDSLFLVDLRALIPKGGSRNAPGRRPPYFAVTLPPFNNWPIDVTVDGDRFMRLRTPVFNGLASAHFRLRGTLGDPRLNGEAIINQGQVLLPFATFNVRQGGVRITEANPFEPALSLIGTGRSFGYDLRMELSGTIEKPVLLFFSTPALESEQVLLMVMAGETPQNEITYTAAERAARLGTYLGQSLLWQLGADPSKTDKLSINVGERVSRHGRETYGIEYELNPLWSLVGEYDEFDEYNLGVKWKVFTSKPETKEAVDAKK